MSKLHSSIHAYGGNAWREALVTKTKVPTYLVEYGFRSKRKDVKFLKDSAYQDKLALVTEKGSVRLQGGTSAEAWWYAEDRKWGHGGWNLGVRAAERNSDPARRSGRC